MDFSGFQSREIFQAIEIASRKLDIAEEGGDRTDLFEIIEDGRRELERRGISSDSLHG